MNDTYKEIIHNNEGKKVSAEIHKILTDYDMAIEKIIDEYTLKLQALIEDAKNKGEKPKDKNDEYLENRMGKLVLGLKEESQALVLEKIKLCVILQNEALGHAKKILETLDSDVSVSEEDRKLVEKAVEEELTNVVDFIDKAMHEIKNKTINAQKQIENIVHSMLDNSK